jgi:AcrR family transcriptional regulator
MGRPKEHDKQTADALLDAAERIVAEQGLSAVSVRTLARDVDTSVRAVYALFGSKDALLISLGTRAFRLLSDALESLPATDDPASDVVEAGVVVFRRFTRSHPALFLISILQTGVPAEISREFRSAQEHALSRLKDRIGRLKDSGRLGPRSESDAVLEFHALCEGLAAMESRNILASEDAEQIWRDALGALVAGWPATDRDRAPDAMMSA